MWPFKKKREQDIRVIRIAFLGEQDGVPERDLKDKLISLFRRFPTVVGAYLARVHYGNPDKIHIALCIRQSSAPDSQVKIEAGKIFSAIFGNHEHLDIMEISTDQEAKLKAICGPFYKK